MPNPFPPFIHVGIDSTDHLGFICGDCGIVCRVVSAETDNGPKPSLKVTRVVVECPNHGILGQRKFYWNPDGGESYDYLTAEKD